MDATKAEEDAKALRVEVNKLKQSQAHLFSRLPNQEALEKRIDQWGEKIKKLKVDIQNRGDNMEVSLTTSRINYMDPRISVAWCKRMDVPIEKIFSKTLRDKFNWAMAVPPDWEFHPDNEEG
mmetsp:Transcript_22418/g.32535  ORF Transcript_22418/g.32535 Transcript_22418/m.32535 type:complete len:122 (-) Transcript_22418:439-804(-)